MKKKDYFFLSFIPKKILVMFCMLLFGISIFAQNVDNKGKDFLMAFLPNTLSTNHAVELHLTGDIATTVTVEYPANSPTFTTTASIVPGTVTIVSLPTTASSNWTPGAIANNAVHAFANEEFVCYMINIENFTSDAALALPITALNTNYIALTYNSVIVTVDRSFFAVVAPFDNTNVTITPVVALASGQPAGVPFTITLNSGEGWLAQGTTFGPAGDLSGTIIQADRPIGVTNGNLCTNVPPNQTYCDHIFEVAHAVQTWGTRTLTANLSNIPAGAIYRVLASENNTTVNQDGAFLATLNKGEFYETPRLPGNHEFSADKPIFVAQYMTGIDPGFGDPAMGNMIPPEQYLSAYTFSTVGGGRYAQHNVTIIAEDVDVNNGTIFLDGASIPAGQFTPIGATGFQATIQALTEGSHNTSSTSGVHGITVWGVNEDDSYLYPGGALFQFIAQGQDTMPPVCQLTIVGNMGNGTVTDNGSDDSGIFFVELEPGSVNLDLVVNPFTPGDPIVTYTVSLIDPNQSGSGIITATDGSGNQCSSIVDIQVSGNNSPVCQINPPGPFVIDENQSLTFDVMASDPDAGDMINLDVSGLPSGSSMTPSLPLTGPNTGISSTFNWTPGTGQAGNYTVDYTVTDTSGAQSTCGVDITVNAPGGDNTSPTCELTAVLPGPPKAIEITVQDGESGLNQVIVLKAKNATVSIPSFTPGTNSPVVVTATKINNSKGASIALRVLDVAGNATTCDPVYTTISADAPQSFDLVQNYPNPFNPTTTIRFAIPSELEGAANVTLKIYDLSGREVKTLINEAMTPGEYSVDWDATNNRGDKVAGGVYLYRLVAGDYTATKKMTLIK